MSWWTVYALGALATFAWAISSAWRNQKDVKEFGWDAILMGSVFASLIWPVFWIIAFF